MDRYRTTRPPSGWAGRPGAPGTAPVRDWRTRVTPSATMRPGRSHRGCAAWAVTGEVLSESEAPWLTRAAGTRPVAVLCVVLTVVALARTGLLAGLLGSALRAMAPFLALFVVGALALALLPRWIRRALRLMALPMRVLTPARPPRRLGPPPAPGRQLMVRSPGGRLEEVLVAAAHRIPPGTRVTAWGPAWGGRRRAWLVTRQGLSGVVLVRGTVACAAAVLLLVAVSAVGLLGDVAR